ncbi:hypothetical protein [Streptomyces sp. CA-111067]|uniref:hypothetical protein n=1 Tax=Streptomyces sp. CA-111067 TaxID=3240046 RepID=UPI003D96D799
MGGDVTPEQPHVRITRLGGGSVEAWGGDGLARALLERAGFTVQWHFNSRYYRLPWDQGPVHENEQATHAAQMLTLAGYRVDLDPQLTAHPAAPAGGSDGGYRLGDQLRALTEAMNGAKTCDAAAALTDQVVHDVDGLLPTLSRFLEAAGQQALAAGTEPARRLASDFEDAAATVTGIAMRLADAGEHLRRLGPPERPAQPDADAVGTVPHPPTATSRPRTR